MPQPRLMCGHRFHLGCIAEWIRRDATCPMCRAVLLRHTRLAQLALLYRHIAAGTSIPATAVALGWSPERVQSEIQLELDIEVNESSL